ncbi:MAG: iron-containing redox enzyme family protein [Moorea sp. SIO4G2]|uniref:Iron-containing redox enzyme family protein n=1 Tax=Moorena bouillonii PNG TaxID=568701 RepID=A0A1U7MX35_9CYAN|nr:MULTISPECIES: iron-containing redox enzyme family protein [Moorena]NEO45285.1 iron-containing redox enzyme family protein [Moorena sp. SIO4A3]NEO59848.1 iron-containing redox enzyme family protein [Moorena sp. SIO4G2]NEO17671.1 iron-containing redox enzyme family protein [Moorena sp. SIO3E8]NEO23016.1 iron-containing redox enzyme family protein [Moorena sp. SIO4A5]NEQ04215.1 iron-containing redox enzyme family protein [Moorena sp. SIO3F7]
MTKTAVTWVKEAQQRRPAEEIVEFCQKHPMIKHPYFVRLQQEPPNLTAFWSYFANLNEVTAKVPNWLANIVMRVEDLRIKSLIAGVLYDELGSGDINKIHSTLMGKLIEGLDPWRPQPENFEPESPGKTLAQEMANFFAGETIDVAWAVGSLISGEVYAEQMISCLGKEVRRQNEVDLSVFEWLLVHEQVEGDHADASDAMSKIVPTSGPELESVMGGAKWKRDTLWAWLDGIYRAAYNELPETFGS